MEQRMEQRMSQQLAVQHQQQQSAHAQDMQHMQQHMEGAFAQQVQQAQQAPQQVQLQAQQQPARPLEIRYSAPPTYDGATVGALDAWLSALKQQCKHHRVTTDEDRIRMAEMVLRGPALEWWQALDDGAPEAASWAAMQAALRARYQPVDNATTARVKLHALRQAPGAAGALEYITAFRRVLVSIKTMSEDDQLFNFMQGLQEKYRMHLRIHNVATRAAAEAMVIHYSSVAVPLAAHAAAAAAPQSAPMDMNHVYDDEEGSTDAESMEHLSREELVERLTAMSSSYRRPAPTTGLNARGAQGARAPPVQGAHSKLPTYSGRTEADMKRCMQKRLCFECQQEGHAARECPLKKSKN